MNGNGGIERTPTYVPSFESILPSLSPQKAEELTTHLSLLSVQHTPAEWTKTMAHLSAAAIGLSDAVKTGLANECISRMGFRDIPVKDQQAIIQAVHSFHLHLQQY